VKIWIEVLKLVKPLRNACSRGSTFTNLVLVVSAMCCIPDGMGVAGMIRSADLSPSCYRRLLNFYGGGGVNLNTLATSWICIVRDKFTLFRTQSSRLVFILDGSDVAKSGRKMPGVHLLHNHSGTKNQAQYYLGHSYQALSVLVSSSLNKHVAVPLRAVLDGGWKKSNRSKKTNLDVGLKLFTESSPFFAGAALLVADAYYCTAKAAEALRQVGAVLVTRCKTNAIAYEQPKLPKTQKRGRPRKYGKKRTLRDTFANAKLFKTVPSPVYGETAVELLVHSELLLWRAAGCLARYVWVMHPTRGNIVLVTTDPDMKPLDVLLTYSLRFKIEVGFKAAKHVVKTFSYRFWMSGMKRLSRTSRTLYLHRETDSFRDQFDKKLHAYHLYVQLGCVAQGALQYLSLREPDAVWSNFRSWMRTMRPEQNPSEQVVGMALASSLPEFLQNAEEECGLQKILLENVDYGRLGSQFREEKRCA
jgi:hypothetical protein